MSVRLRSLAVVLALLAGVSGAAGDQDERARDFVRLSEGVHKLFEQRDYATAAEVCRKLVHLAPGDPSPHYNLACALARLGKKEEALAALEMAVFKGFLPAEHIERDEDLAALRSEERFARCLDKARENERMGGMGYEPAEEIKGVRTVEGSPEGGLRYRLRMSPSATAERPDRLIVWLHPAGGSMNQAVEPLSERFAKLGYALLVLTQKDWRFWSGPDVEKLFTKTLPEVAKVPGLRAESPILMGYSAGGQAALMVWQANPGKFGGLVLDAAYPVRQTPKGVEIVQLPDDPAAKQTPMFVLVGDKDGGSQVWRTLEPIWRRAGVPLTIRYIPDKGHAWLFGPKELDDLAKWLEQLGAGKPPAAPEAPKDREETKPK